MTIKNTKVQVASLVLIFTLSFVFFANEQYFSSGKLASGATGGRVPASIGETTMASTSPETADSLSRNALTQIEENELAEEVAKQSPKRSLASVGIPANDLESLRFGKLEGKYAFKMEGDRVSQISLNEDAKAPITVSDRADFLKQFSTQFGVTSAPKRVSAISKGDTLIETYRMKSVAGNSDRLIRVTVGQANGLLEISSESAPENHIF